MRGEKKSISDLCDYNKLFNIYVIRIPEGKEKEAKKKLSELKRTLKN